MDVKTIDVKTIMVIGSGLMGGGITQVAAQAGYNVIMNDVKMEFIEQGFSTITKLLEGQVKKEKLTAAEKDATLARISKSPDLEEAKKAALILEKLVQSGDLGRKTGKGWYDYTSGERKPRTDVNF